VPLTIAAMMRGDREGEGSEQADVPFTLGLTPGNPGEGGNAAEPDVVDPSPGLGDCGEQSVPALGNGVDKGGRSRSHRSSVSNGTRIFALSGEIDGRTSTARRFRDIIETVTSDLGGKDLLSEAQNRSSSGPVA
jgi:hypothetical protein